MIYKYFKMIITINRKPLFNLYICKFGHIFKLFATQKEISEMKLILLDLDSNW